MAQPPIQGYIDPNFPPPGGDGDAPVVIYGYTPSIVVGVLGCALFLVAAILHLWQLLKYRTWYFSTMMIGIIFVRLLHYSYNMLRFPSNLCANPTNKNLYRKSSATPSAASPQR